MAKVGISAETRTTLFYNQPINPPTLKHLQHIPEGLTRLSTLWARITRTHIINIRVLPMN